MLANQIRPTTLSAAIVFRYIRFWPKKHRVLPFLAIAHDFLSKSCMFWGVPDRKKVFFFYKGGIHSISQVSPGHFFCRRWSSLVEMTGDDNSADADAV